MELDPKWLNRREREFEGGERGRLKREAGASQLGWSLKRFV